MSARQASSLGSPLRVAQCRRNGAGRVAGVERTFEASNASLPICSTAASLVDQIEPANGRAASYSRPAFRYLARIIHRGLADVV